MNGKMNGPLRELDLTDWFVTDTFQNEQLSISASSSYEADLTIPKKSGYRLFAVGGYDCGNESGTRFAYFQLYRCDITIGSGDTDTISVGLRNNYTSSGAKHEITLQLIYIREE